MRYSEYESRNLLDKMCPCWWLDLLSLVGPEIRLYTWEISREDTIDIRQSRDLLHSERYVLHSEAYPQARKDLESKDCRNGCSRIERIE